MTTTTSAGTAAESQTGGGKGGRTGTSPPRRGGRATGADSRFAFWLILPTMVLLGGVVGYPIVRAIVLSLYSDSITGNSEFIGLGNYLTALVGPESGEFWSALETTLFFTVVSVSLEVVLGMVMALVMHRAFRGRGLIRASVLIPWAIPTAVTAVLWRWMFTPHGIVNHVLGTNIIWTGAEWPAKFAIIFSDVWKTSPFVALLLLAGLQIIPDELYDSAKVDGAGAWQRFRTITLPLVKPALVVAVLFRMLDVLRMYDVPAILTGGANDTTTLSILVFQAAIDQTKFSYGSALSTLTFVFIFLVAFAFVRLLGANVLDDSARGVR